MHACMRRAMGAAIFLLVLVLASTGFAQQINIDIEEYGIGERRLVFGDPMGSSPSDPAPVQARNLENLIMENLAFVPFIHIIDKQSILGGTRLNTYEFELSDLERFSMAGADFLVSARWVTGSEVELRVFGVFDGRMIVGKAYSIENDSQLEGVADMFCSAFMEAIDGPANFFRSSLAYVQNKNIHAIRATGRDARQLTSLEGSCLSPAWSPDGQYVVFSHLGDRYHSLGVWDSSGSVTTHPFRNSTVVGPTFTPGNQVAVSLSENGDSDIYLLDISFSNRSPLVRGGGIDVSPDFSVSGGNMAYVSDRFGGPQVFVAGAGGGEGRRVTYQGSYNTDPSLNPEGTQLVYSRRTSSGYRIYLLDLVSGQERQLSYGPGNDEAPAFGPDGYFVAYTSRGRIFLTTVYAEGPIEIPTGGGVSFPAWGITQ